MNKLIFFILMITLFMNMTLLGQTENTPVSDSCIQTIETDTFSYKITTNTCIVQGYAPIVLYSTDICDLKINEIEIKIDNKFNMVTSFNRSGLFKSFSIYTPSDDNRKIELLYCSLQSDEELSDWVRGYYYSLYKKKRNSVYEDIQLNFYMTPSRYFYTGLLDMNVFPFIGNNCYAHVDYQNKKITGNTITYSACYEDENDYNYSILKKIKSDTFLSVSYNIWSTWNERFFEEPVSFQNQTTINRRNNDTVNVQYYYYGDNPTTVYWNGRYKRRFNPIEITDTCGIDREDIRENIIEKRKLECGCDVEINYDEEKKIFISYEVGDIMVTDYSITFYKDTTYNSNRWFGALEWDEFGFHRDCMPGRNQPRKSYYEETDEDSIVNKIFSSPHVTKVSKKDFLINGQNGYDYLLKSYNNKQVLVKEEYEDENGNSIPAEYKLQKEIAEIQELPDKIIVQLTLTDFWYIQLTE